MDGLRQTLDVASRYTSNRYSTVLGGIDRVLLDISIVAEAERMRKNVPVWLAYVFECGSIPYMRKCQSRSISLKVSRTCFQVIVPAT